MTPIERYHENQKNQVKNFRIRAGVRIISDGRLAKGGHFAPLENCEHWDGAPFMMPAQDGIPAVAVRVEISGRTVRYDAVGNNPVIRVRIIFVGDCEPNQTVGGWILAADRERPAG